MDKKLLVEYVNCLKTIDDFFYINSVIRYNIEVVIQGIKPASLLNFSSGNRNLKKLWNIYGDKVQFDNNIKSVELNKSDKRVSVLFYNNDIFDSIIQDDNIMNYLEQYGYSKNMKVEDIVNILKEKFRIQCPHEIGVFLGIPVKDVEAFIKNEGKGYIEVGYWKVYYNREEAESVFQVYDNIKENVTMEIINSIKREKEGML